MLVELKIKTKVHSKTDIDELYCFLYSRCPRLFDVLEEKEYSYNFKSVFIMWSGNLEGTKRLNVKLLTDKLEEIFYSSGLKKCRCGITANGEEYEYIFSKKKKKEV